MKKKFAPVCAAIALSLAIAGSASAQTADCRTVISGLVQKMDAGALQPMQVADAISGVLGKLQLSDADRADLTKAVAGVKANPTAAAVKQAVDANAGRFAGKQCPA